MSLKYGHKTDVKQSTQSNVSFYYSLDITNRVC